MGIIGTWTSSLVLGSWAMIGTVEVAIMVAGVAPSVQSTQYIGARPKVLHAMVYGGSVSLGVP